MAAAPNLAGSTDLVCPTQDPPAPDNHSIFSALVQGYSGLMHAVCRRILGDWGEAQDCVQDAFLNAFRNMTQFEGRAAIATWLHKITVNVALTQLRRRPAQEEPFAAITTIPNADLAQSIRLAEAVFEDHQHRTLMHQAILDLPPSLGKVLTMRDIEGYSTAETAQLLNLTPNATKVRLLRARRALKREVEAKISM